MASGANGRKTFRLILIKPSHYDDDGYVIQWLRSPIPANSLGLPLRARARCAGARRARARSRRSTSWRSTRPTRASARTGSPSRSPRPAGGMVMLVGVQSNQFPRALDIARPLREAGVTVGIGGFHVSGTLAMLPAIDAERAAGARHRLLHLSPARPRRAGSTSCCKDAVDGQPQADLQLHERPARHRARADAAPAGLGDQAHLRREHQLRRRPRLPVPVLVLHHHQRAGPEIAPPLAGRRRAHRARQLPRRASSTSSSPTTISPATRTGSRSSTG